jgi:hypothetical protein
MFLWLVVTVHRLNYDNILNQYEKKMKKKYYTKYPEFTKYYDYYLVV